MPRRSTVLIGDDNDGFRTLLAEFFTDRGFEVGEAGDGEEVLVLAQQRRPSILLLDVRMPALSGLEAYRRLAAELGWVAPAIFMTTVLTPDVLQEARRLNAVALLDKVHLPIERLHRLVGWLLQASSSSSSVVPSVEDAECRELRDLLLDPWRLGDVLRQVEAWLAMLASMERLGDPLGDRLGDGTSESSSGVAQESADKPNGGSTVYAT